MTTPVAFDDLYAAYAAGSLDPAFALLVETRSALKPDLGEKLAASELISGVMLETESETPLAANAVRRALAAIDALDASQKSIPEAARRAGAALDELIALPTLVREAAFEAAEHKGWQAMGQGLSRLTLNCASDLDVELIRIAPGAVVPRHSHAGREYTLVLSGGFSDNAGSYGPGDLTVRGPDDTHRPRGDEDGVCIVLAVRDGGLRFTGVMGFVQRLIGN